MAKRLQLLSSEDAVPATKQHVKPCSDCPWARTALAGWLGSMTADEWLQAAHGEAEIDCHVHAGAQCAGAAIYRTNMCKKPRDPRVLTLPADRERVFSTPIEFTTHHDQKVPMPTATKKKPTKKQPTAADVIQEMEWGDGHVRALLAVFLEQRELTKVWDDFVRSYKRKAIPRLPAPDGRKTIAADELARLAFCNSKKLPQHVSDYGRRKHWVGIGWCDEGPEQGDEVVVIDAAG